MLSELDDYKELRNHSHRERFEQAIQIEIDTLKGMNTWTKVFSNHATEQDKTLISTRWVFKYKFDDQGYFFKYRARLCAREDLQYIETDTYAVTLVSRIFRTFTAIIVAFDLETRQYDAVNTFINN